MTTKKFFINERFLNRVERKTKAIVDAYPNSTTEPWQIRQMVATIESGFATHAQYKGRGLFVQWWNDLCKNYSPDAAWGGFYRTEEAQMIGQMISHILMHIRNGKTEWEINEALYTMRRRWNLDQFAVFVYEERDMIWGYIGVEFFRSQKVAEGALKDEELRTGFKRGYVEYDEMTGKYRLTVESSRKLSQMPDVVRARICR